MTSGVYYNADRHFVKDKVFECKCGYKTTMKTLLNGGEFDQMSFDDNSMPEWFNPFDDDSNGNRSAGDGDRITVPYICHCPSCGERYSVNLATAIFGYDVFDDDFNVIATEDTEPL